MLGIVRLTAHVLVENSPWMAWNLMLALLPLGLALLLFRTRARHSPAWWAGVVAFVLLLPNAPYVLTDVVHLYDDVRAIDTTPVLTLGVVPQYALFFLAGFQTYVVCLLLIGRHLRDLDRGSWVLPMELGVHALCALGVFLGRFHRLNSWDVLHPHALKPALVHLSTPEAIGLIGLTMVIIAATYAVMKEITLAVGARRGMTLRA